MKRKNVCIIVSIVVVLVTVLSCSLFFKNFWPKYYENDIVVLSPDGKYELKIREYDTLGGSGADLFLKELNIKKSSNTKLVFDNYTKPFANGKYIINWESEKVVIKYYSGVPAQDVNNPETWDVKEIMFL